MLFVYISLEDFFFIISHVGLFIYYLFRHKKNLPAYLSVYWLLYPADTPLIWFCLSLNTCHQSNTSIPNQINLLFFIIPIVTTNFIFSFLKYKQGLLHGITRARTLRAQCNRVTTILSYSLCF